MKKFLSIFVAVAMVFSLFAGALAPRASAAVTGLAINAVTDAAKNTTTTPQYYFTGFAATPALTRTSMGGGVYVYKMGNTIHATATLTVDNANLHAFDFQLLARANGPVYTVIDHVTAFEVANVTSYPVQIGTGNVSYDGPYYLRVIEDTNGSGIFGDTVGDPAVTDSFVLLAEPVFIQYNLELKTSTINSCAGFNTIEGWVTRGNGQTVLTPVIVGITYPGAPASLAAYYTVAALSSGQFSLTFPVDPSTQIGSYRIFVRDAYPAIAYVPGVLPNVSAEATWVPAGNDNDAMIYKTLTNMAADIAITASTYYSPVLLYKNVNNQPLLLQLVDQNGSYVQDATWTISTGALFASTPVEVAPGFYHFMLNIASPTTGDVRLTATKNFYGTDKTSTVIINVRDLGAFNPYVDVNAPLNNGTNVPPNGTPGYNWTATPTLDCKTGRYVYDKLPCTIGNALDITVDYWEPLTPNDWYVYDFTPSINGPVRELTGTFDTYGYGKFIIEEAGKISVSISMTMWERIDKTAVDGDVTAPCVDWFSGLGWTQGTFVYGTGDTHGWTPESANACCHTYEKTFDICEVKSCSLVGVTLENGAQTSATAIGVGKKADLVVNVSGANAPAGLSCGCNTKIVHIFMRKCVSGVSSEVTDAFTYDTWGGTTATVDELWYNGITGSFEKFTPDHPFSPDTYVGGLNVMLPNDGTVQFANTTDGAIVVDNCEKLTFKGITFNYTNDQDAPCGYQLVVETFGLERSFDVCGTMSVRYPFISETLNDIDITPAVKTLTTTATVYEMGIDPTDLLAGVPATIEITDPMFSYDATGWTIIDWSYTLGGTPDYLVGVNMNGSSMTSGWKFTFSCGMPKAGDLVITGTSWNTGDYCSEKEILTFTLKVVLPAFDVKIGLADGSIIANDHIITEGLSELIYVVPTDPRVDGHHDFTTDPNWKLSVSAVKNACGLVTSAVCSTPPAAGCTTPSPISVYGLDNPNIEDTPQFRLYFEETCGTKVRIDTFSLVAPTVTVSPTEIPFTIPASATHLVFTVKDAHAHGAPGVEVGIEGAYLSNAGASGYSFMAGAATTDKNGEADWAFVPPYSGEYYVGIEMGSGCFTSLPCGWSAFGALKTITAKYMAPVVDTTAPVVTLTAGLDGSKVSSSMLNLTGKVTDNVGVTQLFVGFNKVDVLPDGSFMVALKLVEGENTITVVAYDAAGNKGTTTAKVTFTAPVDTKIVLVLTIGADIVSVNGKATSIDAAPEIVASRTFVPIRFISESFGATVEWLAETQGITITLGDHTVGLQIGNATAVIDGTIVSLPAAPYIKNGRTMVPLRVISEAFGGDVVWDPAARTITITYQP
jgi:hypothetical protein